MITNVSGDKLPGLFELLSGPVFKGGHQLHEGAVVLKVNTFLSDFNEKFQNLRSVSKVSLMSYTPHEEHRHLQEEMEWKNYESISLSLSLSLSLSISLLLGYLLC